MIIKVVFENNKQAVFSYEFVLIGVEGLSGLTFENGVKQSFQEFRKEAIRNGNPALSFLDYTIRFEHKK